MPDMMKVGAAMAVAAGCEAPMGGAATVTVVAAVDNSATPLA